MENKVVTRFAPSPTGLIHVGNIHTALYAWLWVRKNKGTFILRIEDTDKKREVVGSIEHIKKTLKWLGLDWDEGPDVGGPHAPYIQSERMGKLNIYQKYAEKLIAKGFAYADVSSEEEVQKLRDQAEAEKKAFLFRDHRPENPPTWKPGMPLRFKIRELKRTTWQDAVRGELTAGPEALDDFILIKSDGYPTYNFAHIVDDIEMGVTHITRGQEFISSTPNYIAVYEALEVAQPIYVTVPHIMGAEGKKKLGKRDGAKDILDYEKDGFLPEAMFNFLAFMGWNPGGEKEIMSREEIISLFDISRIQKSGAQFNEEKLDWFNKEHIKKLSDTEFIEKARQHIDFISPISEQELENLILTFRDRITKFSDLNEFMKGANINSSVVGLTRHMVDNTNIASSTSNKKEKTVILVSGPNDYLISLKDPTYQDIKLLIPKDSDGYTTIKYLAEVKKLAEENDWEKIIEKNDESALWAYASKEGRGKVLWPLRVALSGEMKSPDPFEIMKIIKKDATLRRIDKAILQLQTNLL
ncbi:glutamate--tRNA ligase [Candidatus Nomurabacteria bacterium]|nr:glutamate--tRNA ligase [Candidatus Nomurabacteria bacterium]